MCGKCAAGFAAAHDRRTFQFTNALRLDHFCAILIEEKLCYMKVKNEDKEDELL